MLFATFQFAIFFAITLVLCRSLPPRRRIAFLLAASLVFYGMWFPLYLALLLADIGVNHALLRAIARSRRPGRPLAAAVISNLVLLAIFKYAAFAVSTTAPLTDAVLGWSPPVPEIVLPLGISFYTFQIIALAVDTYRGEIEEVPSLSRYALYVCFFPQLIAGPILRGHQFLPQLVHGGATSPERTRRGMWLVASGVAKKVLVADFLLAPFVNEVFGQPGAASAPVHALAVYGFAFQIYYDFSGYVDMARGMGCLLGFELPRNFEEPYLARDPAEFWRRWHITLSSWLRDYLYVPLGGNRRGELRTLANLQITMLLGGLWHGAAWTFVIWGGLHGLLLVAHRALGARPDPARPLRVGDVPRIALMFTAVALLLVFFRSPSVHDALGMLGALVRSSYLVAWPSLPTLVVLFCVVLHPAERFVRLRGPRLRAAFDRPWGPAVEGLAFGVLAALAIAASGAGGEFIYFQF